MAAMNWKVKSLLRNVRTFFYTFTMKSIHLSISALDQFSSGDFFDPSNYHNYRKICKIKFLTIKRNKDKLVSAWKIKRKKKQNKTKQIQTENKKRKINMCALSEGSLPKTNSFLLVRFAINLIECVRLT